MLCLCINDLMCYVLHIAPFLALMSSFYVQYFSVYVTSLCIHLYLYLQYRAHINTTLVVYDDNYAYMEI